MDFTSGAHPIEPMQHGSLRAVQSMSRLQSTNQEAEVRKAKSIRARPTELMDRQESVPRLPLNDSTQTRKLQTRSSKLSLFHLFSKPKVEKLRGYTETDSQPVATPVGGDSRSAANSEADITVQRQGTGGELSSTRPGSSRSHNAARSTKLTPKERATTIPQQRRSAPFSPPPLFQAYPQATKHGVLEIPAVSPDSTQRSKSNRSGSLQVASVETVRKIFVLITSGYLLQYAYDGPSDRQPERILELGEESAAFACDLVPGQHFVLQVSHAVSRHGIIATNSTSLLTRLGLRGNTSRRMVSNCWLVLTTAEEMDSWMLAIRQEIEILGGSRARGNLVAALSAANEPPQASLEKVPSASHRYQVRRDPSKVLSVVSPTDTVAFPGPLTPSVKVDGDKIETATIDDIEIEASAIGSVKRPSRARAASDAPSASSSTAMSVEQQQLEKIRNSIRISHTSSRTTGLTSRTNSPTSSYPSDGPSKGNNFEPILDATASAAPYRASQAYTSGSRRSLLPLLLSRDDSSSETKELGTSTVANLSAPNLESPDRSLAAGHHQTSVDILQSPPMRLSMAQSVPNLKASTAVKKRHDSKVQSPREIGSSDRPESVLGELPSPSAWASKTSPKSRNSTFLLASGAEPSISHTVRRAGSQSRRRTGDSSRQLSGPSASFSLPLKINAPDQPSARSVRRASQALDQAGVASPVPVVHTLTAKVDLATRTTISNAHIPPRRSSNAGSFGVDPTVIASENANLRLSPFLSQPPPFLPFAGDRIKRSPSASALSSQSSAQAAVTALKRPTSMQVRSSNAPFLSNVRNSGRGLPLAPMRPGTTVPIRSLKPSRSSLIMQSPGFLMSQDPFYEAKLASVALAAEAGEEGLSLPVHHSSPPNPIMKSPPVISSRRTSRVKSATLLELGMPLAALGPPAPPPQAPLPEIPTTSKPNSPTSDTGSIPKTRSRKQSPARPGLGIQIVHS